MTDPPILIVFASGILLGLLTNFTILWFGIRKSNKRILDENYINKLRSLGFMDQPEEKPKVPKILLVNIIEHLTYLADRNARPIAFHFLGDICLTLRTPMP